MTAIGVVDFLKRSKDRMNEIMDSTGHGASVVARGPTEIPAWVDTPRTDPATTGTGMVVTDGRMEPASAPEPIVVDTTKIDGRLTADPEPARHDAVMSPSHYCREGFELGEVLYVWGLTHRRASAVEYIMRAGEKATADEVEDLRKAIRNLQMELDYMERYGRRG